MNKKDSNQSISLNSNTFIQQYNNLQSSGDNFSKARSSNFSSQYDSEEKELTQIQLQYLKRENPKKQYHKHKQENRRQKQEKRGALRLQNGQLLLNPKSKKYYMSPSTKQQLSLLKLNHPQQGGEISFRQLRSDYLRQNDNSGDSQTQKIRRQQSPYFNMNAFLNAHPVPISNKGRKVLEERSKHFDSHESFDKQQKSIELITLPEPPERPYYCRQLNFEYRFEQAKLNFIDSFMPDNMKIKKNPYALLKYIQSKRPFSKFV